MSSEYLKNNNRESISSNKRIIQSNINPINNINNTNININTNNNIRTLQPTNYTSVKILMQTKFKKGIKEKVPVNILAMP